MTHRGRRAVTLGLLGVPAIAEPGRRGWAQTAPGFNAPITIIVPYTAGTGQDTLARLIAPVLQAALGPPVVVENRPGASGSIGSQAVARAAPDGRVLMLQANTFVMAPRLFRQLPYDPTRNFTPIIHLTDGELVLVSHAGVPVDSPRSLVDLAKRSPRAVAYASPGIGTPQHLAMELFRLAAGRPEMDHIPYRGSAPAIQDLLGQRVPAMMLPLHTALPLAAEGRIRLLAIGSPQRSAAAPEVPTMAESGFPGAQVGLWYGLFAPAGLPEAVRDRLNAVLAAWLARPETVQLLLAQGMTPAAATDPDTFATLVARDAARWAEVIEKAGITAD